MVLVSAGQANDAPVFEYLLAQLRVPRLGGGAARTRPDRVRGDMAYSSRAIRTELRRRGIIAVIPQPSDQIVHRQRKGSRGGRPPAGDVNLVWPHQGGADSSERRNIVIVGRLRWLLCGRLAVA